MMENGKRLRIDAWRTRTAYLLLRRQLLYPDELKRRRVYSTVNARFLQDGALTDGHFLLSVIFRSGVDRDGSEVQHFTVIRRVRRIAADGYGIHIDKIGVGIRA